MGANSPERRVRRITATCLLPRGTRRWCIFRNEKLCARGQFYVYDKISCRKPRSPRTEEEGSLDLLDALTEAGAAQVLSPGGRSPRL